MAQLNDLFAGVIPFVSTAESRSFRRAAERLGVTPAAISKAVAKLEDELGVRLLLRSSRRVSLTPEGDEFLQRCREAIAGVQGAREVVARAGRAPHGEVVLTLPYILAPQVVPSLGELGARYPRLVFRLQLTDRLSRMIEEGIDVAVRIGELEDSSLVKRLLRRTRWMTLAAPSYLARHPAPASPADLARHNCLRFVAPNGRPRDWTFASEGAADTVRVEGNLLTDQGSSLLDAALAGMGVCQVLDFMVNDLVHDGRLVEVLPARAADGPPVHALCLPGRERSPNGRALIEFLVTLFKR